MARTYTVEVTLMDAPDVWRPYPGASYPTLTEALQLFHRRERQTWKYANVRILIDGQFTGIIAR